MIPAPWLAGARPRRWRDIPLVLIGIPLLVYSYTWLNAIAVVDIYVLRRRATYAKTAKPG